MYQKTGVKPYAEHKLNQNMQDTNSEIQGALIGRMKKHNRFQ